MPAFVSSVNRTPVTAPQVPPTPPRTTQSDATSWRSEQSISQLPLRELSEVRKYTQAPETKFDGESNYEGGELWIQQWRQYYDVHMPIAEDPCGAQHIIDKLADRLTGKAEKWYRAQLYERKLRKLDGWDSFASFESEFMQQFETQISQVASDQLQRLDASNFTSWRDFNLSFGILVSHAGIM